VPSSPDGIARRPCEAASPDAVALALVAWAQTNGRHDLPWQLDPTPYRVWVSEVMLQQTQVATVIPYFERFVARFPDVGSLSAAPLDEVLHLWTGLGYYARARNLHTAARIVVEQYEGRLPRDIDALQTLPGIGRSTAGAILALSWGQRHPILDGNARRVLSRLFAVDGDPGASSTLKRLWTLAEACTPDENVAEYTQAIMDLGAGVCLRSRPRCDVCPLSEVCVARQTNRQLELPSRRRRTVRPRRTAYALVIRDAGGTLLLKQRPANGVWGGLWSLPQFDSEPEALAWLAAIFPTPINSQPAESQHHAFTHYELELHLRTVCLDVTQPEVPKCVWYDTNQAPPLGLGKPVTNLT
jgi:A/G-specific adenine glycosylase